MAPSLVSIGGEDGDKDGDGVGVLRLGCIAACAGGVALDVWTADWVVVCYGPWALGRVCSYS